MTALPARLLPAAPIVLTLLLCAGCATPLAPAAPATAARPDATTSPAPAPVSAPAAAPTPTWPTTLQCGARLFQIESQGDGLRLRGDGDPLALQPVPSATGVKLVATAQPTTSAWLRGDHARVVLQGQALPECRILNREAP